MIKNVVILDRHPVYSTGLKTVINSNAGYSVAACCHSEEDLFGVLECHKAEIAVIDCAQPDNEKNVIKLIYQLSYRYPGLSMLAVGECERHKKLAAELYPLVQDYFCKTREAEEFILTLNEIKKRRNADMRGRYASTGIKPVYDLAQAAEKITAKEMLVIKYLLAGYTVTQIADKVHRSIKTVSSQKRTAMKKLGFRSNRDIFRMTSSY